MVYIFKTNVYTSDEVNLLEPKLNFLFPNIKWIFDLEDCDKILRIESSENIVKRYYYFIE